MYVKNNKKRGIRRHLTEKYRNKQLAIYRSHYGQSEWFLRFSRFGEYREAYGRFKHMAAMNCGVRGCPHCCNPRFSNFVRGKHKLTIPEQINNLSFKEQLIDLDNT